MPYRMFLWCFILWLLTACGMQSAPQAVSSDGAAQAVSSDGAAQTGLALVTAFAGWDEPTIARVIIADETSAIRLAATRDLWSRWISLRLGAFTTATVQQATTTGDTATLTIESIHAQGSGFTDLTLERLDGQWRVRTWNSYRP